MSVDVRLDERLISCGSTARSHCLSVSSRYPLAVFATECDVAVVSFEDSSNNRILSVPSRAHTKPVTCLKRVHSCDASDELYVSGATDGRVVVWSIHENQNVLVQSGLLDALGGSVGCVCATRNGDRLLVAASFVAATNAGMRLTWLRLDQQKWVEECHSELPALGTAIAISCDVARMNKGDYILAVGTSRRTVELYTGREGSTEFTPAITVPAHGDWVHALAFNRDLCPNLLASVGQEQVVKLWRIEEVKEESDEDADELHVTKNRFNMADMRMCISVEAVLVGHEDWVHGCSWDVEGQRLATASSDKAVVVWEEDKEAGLWTDQVRLGVVGGQSAGFYSAAFSHCGNRLLAASYFGGLHAWRSEDGLEWTPLAMPGGSLSEVRDAGWDPRGNWLAVVSKDQTTRCYAQLHGKDMFVEMARPQVHGHDMQCIAVVNSALFVSGAEEKITRAFRAPRTFADSLANITGKNVEEVNIISFFQFVALFFPLFGDCSLASSGARVPALGLSNKAVEEGDAGAAGPGEEVHWEEAQFQAQPAVLTGPPTEDCLQQNTLWPEEHKQYGHGFELYAVAAHPNGGLIATACKASHPSHATILLWETNEWRKVGELSAHQLTVTQMEWSGDGERMISVSRDRTVAAWKEVDGVWSCVWRSDGRAPHSRIVWSCAWHHGGKHFATGSRDGKVVLWEWPSDGEPRVLAEHKCPHPVTAVEIGGTGEMSDALVVAGLQDGSLLFLSLSDGSLVECGSALRPSVPSESPVLRLRFRPTMEGRHQMLAVAGTDCKTRVFQVQW